MSRRQYFQNRRCQAILRHRPALALTIRCARSTTGQFVKLNAMPAATERQLLRQSVDPARSAVISVFLCLALTATSAVLGKRPSIVERDFGRQIDD
jgi:hypothetical protein